MLNLLLFNTVLDIKIKKEKNKKKKKNKKNYNQLFKHEKLMFILDCQALAFYNKLKKRKYKNKCKIQKILYIHLLQTVRSFLCSSVSSFYSYFHFLFVVLQYSSFLRQQFFIHLCYSNSHS